jgi:predicted ATPase
MRTLCAFLRVKELLLVLDNFEPVLAAAALVAELLAACPWLNMLVTSREMLHLRGEHEVGVAPLALPARTKNADPESLAQNAAVALFVARVQEIKPDFALSNATAPVIAEICHRLDGLPLAIELAAARVKLLSPPALLARLERRLPLLVGGQRDLPARQQTLRDTIAWSYDLLGLSEQTLFRRLGVFAGGCTLEAAEALCAGTGDLDIDVLHSVSSLVDKNLLQQDARAEGEPRLGMLETIREYALERLHENGEMDAVQRDHAAYCLALAEAAEPELTGPRQVAWAVRLETEHDNLRAAMSWARQNGESDLGMRLAGALWRFWYIHGHLSEGQEWLKAMLAHQTTERGPARAKGLNGAGVLARNQGDYSQAAALLAESLALQRDLEDRRGVARVLLNLGTVAHDQAEYDQAIAYYNESLVLWREVGETWGAALALNNIGAVAVAQGDYPYASAMCGESLTLFGDLGDSRGRALALSNLGNIAHAQGDYDRAIAFYAESLALYKELGDKRDSALVLNSQGDTALEQGDVQQAMELFRQSLVLYQEVGDKVGMVECLEGVARVAYAQGHWVRAARLCGAAEDLRAAIAAPMGPADQSKYQRLVASLATALGDDAFATSRSAGHAMTLEEALAEAMAACQPA